MRKIKYVNISGILFDKLPINPAVLYLVYFISGGGKVPPIKLIKTKSGYKLKDGRHRLAAYKLLGQTHIEAKYYEPEKPKIMKGFINEMIENEKHAEAMQEMDSYDNNTVKILQELLEFSEGGGETLESLRQRITEIKEGLQ